MEPKNFANNQKQEVCTRISDGDSNSIYVEVYKDGEKVKEAEISYLTPSEEDANVKPEGEISLENENVRGIIIAIAQTNPNLSPEFMKLADKLEQENQEYLEDQKANSDVEEEDEHDEDGSEADSE